MKKKATIKDIARIAGVSATAVSRALNNHPRLSAGTREKILRVAKELDYRPNLLARSLIKKRSHTIGLAITTIRNPFYPELAKGIEDVALKLGYSIILCSTNYDIKLEAYYIEILRSKGVDGIIFSSVEIKDSNVRNLIRDGFPFVLVNRRIHNRQLERKIDAVVLDNYSGGYMAMQHLQRLGHKRIGILAGDMKTSTATERTQGIKKFLEDAGIPFDPTLFFVCNYLRESAYGATMELLVRKKRPTAIFAQNDHMALGAREAILDSGLRIPEDLAVVGFDNIDVTGLKGIELTTVSQKKYEMGALATEILIDRIEKKIKGGTRQIILEPELVIRKSCGYHVNRNG